jgi:hypothetical protein
VDGAAGAAWRFGGRSGSDPGGAGPRTRLRIFPTSGSGIVANDFWARRHGANTETVLGLTSDAGLF